MSNFELTAILCSALLVAQPYAFAQQATPAGVPQNQTQTTYTPQQLDSLVAPIALYPDPILSQILVASTYPLEIVEAGRFVSQHPELKGQYLADAARQKNWDASVQALVATPDVLNRLNQDITWTSNLGNAFLAQQGDVMDAIQRLRVQAKQSGVLNSTPQQTVSTETQNGQTYITIEPPSPNVVYVPQYNPVAVWGAAPDYYPYPSLYYPPYYPGMVAASVLSFGAGIALGAFWGGGWGGWGGWGWHPGWGGRNIIVNNNFIRSNRFNRVNVGAGNAWVHNPMHRGGVPYGNRQVMNRFQGGGARVGNRPTVGQVQRQLGGGFGHGGAANRLAPGAANRMAPGNIGQRGGANRMAPGNIGQRGGANRMAPGNIGQRGGANRMAPGFGQGGANRMAPGFGQGGANRMGNRGFGGGGFHGGGFGGRGFGGGGFHGRGFGGGGFRGGGRRR